MLRILLSLAIIFQTLIALGQIKPKQEEDWQETFFHSSEIVLPILIDAAVKHSAQLESLDAAKQIIAINQNLEKKRILNGISVGSGYSYGSTYNVVDQSGNRPGSGFNPFNLPTQSLYNVGVQGGVSLYTLLGRRYELQKQSLALKQAEASRKIGERELRQTVISLYQQLLLAKTEQEISQEAYQTTSLRFKLAEKRFANREIEIDDMFAIQEFYSRARVARETARINYETSFLLMEELIGMKIIDLMSSK